MTIHPFKSPHVRARKKRRKGDGSNQLVLCHAGASFPRNVYTRVMRDQSRDILLLVGEFFLVIGVEERLRID